MCFPMDTELFSGENQSRALASDWFSPEKKRGVHRNTLVGVMDSVSYMNINWLHQIQTILFANRYFQDQTWQPVRSNIFSSGREWCGHKLSRKNRSRYYGDLKLYTKSRESQYKTKYKRKNIFSKLWPLMNLIKYIELVKIDVDVSIAIWRIRESVFDHVM